MGSEKSGSGEAAVATENRGILERFSNFVDQHLIALRFGLVSMGVCGVVLICRRLHISHKFSRANEIPDWFYQRHISLYGQLKGISTATSNNKQRTVLKISHTPILRFKFRSAFLDGGEHKHLHVSLWGISNDAPMELTRSLADQLANGTKGRLSINVRFVLMSRSVGPDDNVVSALCFVRRNWHIRRSCLNETVLWSGAARTAIRESPDELQNDVFQQRWQTRLTKAQQWAVKRRVGVWNDGKQPTLLRSLLRKSAAAFMRLFSGKKGGKAAKLNDGETEQK